MSSPWFVFFILFILFTVLPSMVAFAVGRWGLPRLVWSRQLAAQKYDESEEL
jgi:hypothetical protein